MGWDQGEITTAKFVGEKENKGGKKKVGRSRKRPEFTQIES